MFHATNEFNTLLHFYLTTLNLNILWFIPVGFDCLLIIFTLSFIGGGKPG